MQDIVATFIACSVVICAIDSVTLADHCDDIVKDLRQSGAEVSFRETAETGREAYVRFDLRTITDQDMQKISRVPRLISLGFNLCEIPPDSWLHLNGHPHLRELTDRKSVV